MAMTERDKRALMILGGIAGLAIVFFLVTKVLGGGGGEAAAPPAGGSGSTEPTAVPTSPSPTATPTPRQIVSFSGRDPFSPPAQFVSSSPTSSTSTSPSGSTSPTSTATTNGTAGTDGTGTGGTGTLSAPSTGSVGGHDVHLFSVDRRRGVARARLAIDARAYTVTQGERFDTTFRLVGAEQGCARILFGDEAFTLCE